jgi:hypothetical protein
MALLWAFIALCGGFTVSALQKHKEREHRVEELLEEIRDRLPQSNSTRRAPHI